MTAQNFNNQSANGLGFSGITGSETDVGAVLPFLPASDPQALTLTSGGTPFTDLLWGALNGGVGSAGASQSISVSFNVTDTNAGELLTGLQFGVTADQLVGTGVGFTGIIQAYSGGILVGQSSISDANPTAPPLNGAYAPTDTKMFAGYSSLTISFNVTFTEAVTASAGAYELYSVIQAGIGTVTQAQTCTIGDYVWNDTNADGIQSAGETGVSGVTVQLLDSTGKYLGLTTTTDATGHYSFTNLVAGTYEVGFVNPGAGTFTVANAGTLGADSVVNQATGISGPITVAAGTTNNTVDAGLILAQPVVINAVVFADTNGNGMQDAGETGIPGVTVNLLDANGNVVTTTTTNSSGQ